MLGEVDPEITHAAFVGHKSHVPSPVKTLESISEAWSSYGGIVRGWLYQVHHDNIQYELTAGLLGQWREAFTELVRKQQVQGSERKSWALLEADYRMFTVTTGLFAPSTNHDSLKMDDNLGYMKEIVDYAEIAAGWSEGSESITPFFSFDMGINHTLFMVAGLCRDPVVRRRAIALLEAANRQEGVWNGRMAARVARYIIVQEEQGRQVRSSRDVPADVRLRGAQVDISGNHAEVALRFAQAPEHVHVVPLW